MDNYPKKVLFYSDKNDVTSYLYFVTLMLDNILYKEIKEYILKKLNLRTEISSEAFVEVLAYKLNINNNTNEAIVKGRVLFEILEKVLIEKYAKNFINFDLWRPNGNETIEALKRIEELIKNGEDPNEICYEIASPMELAVTSGHITVIEKLLELGGTLNKNQINNLIENFKYSTKNLSVIKTLMKKGLDISAEQIEKIESSNPGNGIKEELFSLKSMNHSQNAPSSFFTDRLNKSNSDMKEIIIR